MNAQCARLLMQTISESGTYDRGDFLESYVDFMVTPGSHNDTFAGTLAAPLTAYHVHFVSSCKDQLGALCTSWRLCLATWYALLSGSKQWQWRDKCPFLHHAEAFHRGFFKNFSKGLSVFDCAGVETHDTASVGALVMLPIIALTYHYDVELAKRKAVEHVRLTHNSSLVERSAEVWTRYTT